MITILCLLLVLNVSIAKDVFTIAGLFYNDNYQAEISFKYALKLYNMFNQDIKFHTRIEHVHTVGSFAINKLVCEMVPSGEGLVALFGPEFREDGAIVISIAADLEIPHVSTQKHNTFPQLLSTSIQTPNCS